MYIPEEKLEVTQISLTGTRSLVLMGLLIIAPRNFQEIKETFINMGIFDKKGSDDILRIDLNTIKSAGCEISRPTAKNNYKYIMQKHPYVLNLTEDDTKLLRQAYKKVKDNISIETLFDFDDLFRKLSENTEDEEIKERILGISVLKYYNVEKLKEMYSDCKKQNILELLYKTPEKQGDVSKRIKAQKLVFQNDKIYLYGHDLEVDVPTVLLYKRIKKVLSKTSDNKMQEQNSKTIVYRLKNLEEDCLKENEKILEKKEGSLLIQGTFYNEFFALQRVLSFGSNCTVVEPVDFKTIVIKNLKEMQEVYNG